MTIVGANIKTASSPAQRVELNSSYLTAYDASNNFC
jgi:hypothetical protein